MAQLPLFDLHTLSPDRFQELCAAVLFKYFSPIVEPFGTPGRDGGIDILHEPPPVSYEDLFDHAFCHQDRRKKKSTWVFQCKFTTKVQQDARLAQIQKYWKKEIDEWKKYKYCREGIAPDHLILMTNIRLSPKARSSLKKLIPKHIKFHVWDGYKLNTVIAGDNALTFNSHVAQAEAA